MSRHDRDLWQQVSTQLKPRPGWTLEASSTPGAPMAWCFIPHVHTRLAVGVDSGTISVYLEDLDEELRFDDMAAFSTWLDANEQLFAGPNPPGSEELNATLRRKLDEWRGPTS